MEKPIRWGSNINRTVAPKRPPNKDLRTRENLTEAEVERLIKAPRTTATATGTRPWSFWLIGMASGLRSWLTFAGIKSTSERPPSVGSKQGTPSTHPILGDELRALRRLHREQEPKSPFVFTSERAAPFTTAGFARMIERAGKVAKLSFKAHPHMLRHACRYALANRGHDTRALQSYLGHKNIQHTSALHGTIADSVQEFLAGVSSR
jgi:integrase